MTEHITTERGPPFVLAPPVLPDWLRRFLGQGEEVITLRAPAPSRLLNHKRLFIGVDIALFVAASILLVLLLLKLSWHKQELIASDLPGAAFLAFFGVFIAAIALSIQICEAEKKDVWQVITNRRLFVVQNRKKTEEYDLDVLRRFLVGLAPPGATGQTDDRLLDLTRFSLTAASSKTELKTAFANLDSILAIFRLGEQMRGLGNVAPIRPPSQSNPG